MANNVSPAKEQIKLEWLMYLNHQLEIGEIDKYVYNKFADKGLELMDRAYAADRD